jgi:hypothetical protein
MTSSRILQKFKRCFWSPIFPNSIFFFCYITPRRNTGMTLNRFGQIIFHFDKLCPTCQIVALTDLLKFLREVSFLDKVLIFQSASMNLQYQLHPSLTPIMSICLVEIFHRPKFKIFLIF